MILGHPVVEALQTAELDVGVDDPKAILLRLKLLLRYGASPSRSMYDRAMPVDSRAFLFRSILASAAWSVLLFSASTPAFGQWLKFPDIGTPRTADGKPNLSAPAPKTADGK